MKNLKNMKITHGAIIDENEDSLFDVSNANVKKVKSEIPKDLEHLSIAELKLIAEDLSLLAVDSKPLLIKAIKKTLKKK